MKKVYLNTLTTEEVIKRLKNGEVVKCDTGTNRTTYRIIDNIIVGKDENGTIINDCITIDDSNDYYFEEENQFEITGTGVYRTRDGRKAYVFYIDVDGDCTFVIEGTNNLLYHTSKQGRCNKNIEYGGDLVAKWED